MQSAGGLIDGLRWLRPTLPGDVPGPRGWVFLLHLHGQPTPIRCHVVQITGGLWLDGITNLDDAESLRGFFREQELPASIDADGGVLLLGLTMEHFFSLVEQANIELI